MVRIEVDLQLESPDPVVWLEDGDTILQKPVGSLFSDPSDD